MSVYFSSGRNGENAGAVSFKMITTLIFLAITFVSGIFYRMGGSGNYPRWIRHVGTSSCVCAAMGLFGLIPWQWHGFLALFLTFGLLFAALTSYFKKKGTDAKWWNWMFVGLAVALSFAPIIIVNHLWIGWGLTAIFLCGSITLWSLCIGNAVIEEIGRGVIIVLSVAVLGIAHKLKRKEK